MAFEEGALRQAAGGTPHILQPRATSSGVPVRVVHQPDPEQLADEPFLSAVGFPGEYPFTRGIHPTMYRSRPWTMRQYAGFGTAEESNARYRFLLAQGQTGLSVAFDLPTQMGLDPDHPRAAGEVGRVGVSIATLGDMETLMRDIPQGDVSVSMTINATATTLLGLYCAVARQRGVDWKTLEGTVQNDILKEYMARGTYIFPPAPSLRLTTDLFAFCAREVPSWNTISISGYHIREAGCTAAQELAFTLGDGAAYVQAAVDRGLDVDEFAGRLSFFFNVHNHFLEEVAKFRAARRMWARIMRERFRAKNPRSWMLRFHTQTAGSTLTAQQPDNNVVRVTLQALAAVMGGTQSLHTNSRDEALGLPTEASARLALRTQQVIAYESGVADTVDPFAGSYVVEQLTDALEARARALLERVDALGGMVRAIEQGWPQHEIQDAAYQAQRAVEEGRQVVVGVNRFQAEEVRVAALQLDPAMERARVEQVRAWRAARPAAAVADALRRLGDGARGDANLVPLIVEAVAARATLGEVADALRAVFGEHRESVVL
ncbi:MAG: methylmalonyl-CoA mutase [Deltaproteobacteria bacterium]|nr:methylmalonyl-CoA mutase [Deltaproteobacteria bacterium]